MLALKTFGVRCRLFRPLQRRRRLNMQHLTEENRNRMHHADKDRTEITPSGGKNIGIFRRRSNFNYTHDSTSLKRANAQRHPATPV